jgi:hypothetical protein
MGDVVGPERSQTLVLHSNFASALDGSVDTGSGSLVDNA